MISYTVGCLVLVLCIGTSLAQYSLEWKPTKIELIEQGPSVTAKFGFFDGSWRYGASVFKCSFSRPSTLAITPEQSIIDMVITGVSQWYEFTFRALDDHFCHDREIKIFVRCESGVFDPVKINVTKPMLAITIKNIDPASACKDPHLTQRVNGIDANGESVTKKVCYDLYGKSGDRLELMSDNLLRTSIVFELRDDYYIGKAFYSTKLGKFNFTTTKISLPSLQMKKWGLEDNFVIGSENTYPHAVVKQSQHDVSVIYNEENRSESIRIVKIQQSYGKSYLNVLVEKSATRNGVFDANHGGIFGVIANQEYEFYEPVQNEGNIAVVRINGRFVKSFLKGSPNETDRCYSMSLEDMIYPMNVDSFQKSL